MSRYYSAWAPYVPVAERRKRAARELEKLRKKGYPAAPVIIEGRAVATSFWGKAWCSNLESYHDFENRLPRGRSYVRNGAVIDLQIAPLAVTAQVCGSSIYKVSVGIQAVAKAHWQSLCRDCGGSIDSLVELLQGRLSKGVMERLCRQDTGLFPKPAEIRFSCSCPDSASMCKHVAAVLYGVGARLDEKPELLFRLRAVNEKDLLVHAHAAAPLPAPGNANGNILEIDDISALFGIEMAGAEEPPPPPPPPPAPAKRARNREDAPIPSVRSQQPADSIAPKRNKAPARPAKSKPPIEYTPDGFVKWWK